MHRRRKFWNQPHRLRGLRIASSLRMLDSLSQSIRCNPLRRLLHIRLGQDGLIVCNLRCVEGANVSPSRPATGASTIDEAFSRQRGDHLLGLSRGEGEPSKLPLIADAAARLFAAVVTPGQADARLHEGRGACRSKALRRLALAGAGRSFAASLQPPAGDKVQQRPVPPPILTAQDRHVNHRLDLGVPSVLHPLGGVCDAYPGHPAPG
jgi:hypothetical protein